MGDQNQVTGAIVQLLHKKINVITATFIMLVLIMAVIVCSIVVQQNNQEKRLKQFFLHELQQQYDKLELERKQIADSMRFYRRQIDKAESRDIDNSRQMQQQENELTKIRKRYETLPRFDNYNADSIKRDFAAEFGK
jgi:peptidoglycan hydrolase CwlO-like protein